MESAEICICRIHHVQVLLHGEVVDQGTAAVFPGCGGTMRICNGETSGSLFQWFDLTRSGGLMLEAGSTRGLRRTRGVALLTDLGFRRRAEFSGSEELFPERGAPAAVSLEPGMVP